MQTDTLISVIIPVYNVEKYLECCLKSVVNQTYPFIEIILVDDGSIDSSGRICDNFAKKDERLRVIHKENGGPVSARNTGLRAARGKYICYVDSDDWMEPDMLERLFKTMLEENTDIVMCGYYEATGSQSKPVYHGLTPGRYDKEALIKNVYPNMMVNKRFFEWGIIPGLVAKLFKRKAIEQCQLEEDERIKMGDDAACVYPALLLSNSIYIMKECLYHYRQVLTSLVRGNVNPDAEREQYQVMYQYTRDKLLKLCNIYDCVEQWDKYVLFLMFQRADVLYRDLETLDFFFPFPKVKRGKRIVLYGAGTYGQRLHRYLENTEFCKVAGWVDRNYSELNKLGLKVDPPSAIHNLEYDYIVIAITYASSRESAYRDLAANYGSDKVITINEDLILSESSKIAFGLKKRL